jgi:hypothetical protein
MQLTIYYKDDDKWLVEKIGTKAYGDRKSVSQVILTTLEQYFTSQGDGTVRPHAPRVRKRPGPKPGSKRKKRGG